MGKSSIQKVMATSLLPLIFFISAVFALELSSPESVNLNDSFEVSVSSQASELSDIKIFAANDEKKIISEIFNDGWKNPFYYLKSVFPEQTIFKIRILEAGEYDLCVRLRPSGKSSFEEKCNPIQVILGESGRNSEEKEKTSEENDENPKENEEEVNEEDKKEKINEETEQEINSKVLEFQSISTPGIEKAIRINNTKIIINSPSSKNKIAQEPLILKEGRNQLIIFYSFTAFCIIIIVLLSMRYL